MPDTTPREITSPHELETRGFIRIRGRILGNARLGKRAGIAAMGVLVLLVAAILYGVTLNSAHVGAPSQNFAKPLPASDDRPWWQSQSDATHAVTRRSDDVSVESNPLPTGVPDLSRIDDAPTPAPLAHRFPTHVRVTDMPVQDSKFPTIPPIDENSMDSDTNQSSQQRATSSIANQREALRQAAMMSPPLLSDQASITAAVSVDVAQSRSSPISRPASNPLASAKIPPTSPFELVAGSIIPATLITAIDSDLPGLLMAQVRQPTYDTAAGRFLLIPQGARLVGTYDSKVAYGQDRLLVTWMRIVFPDGSSADLQAMAGADPSGRSGFDAQVDNHTRKLFQGALLLSIIGAGAQLSQPQQSATNGEAPSVGQMIAASVGSQIANAGTQLMQRQLSVPPNLRLPAGYQFDVIVDHDVDFAAPYPGD